MPGPSRNTAPPKGGRTRFVEKIQMDLGSASILLPKSIGNGAGLGWIGPGWAALGWSGSGWAGPGSSSAESDVFYCQLRSPRLAGAIASFLKGPPTLRGRASVIRATVENFIYIYIYIYIYMFLWLSCSAL